MTDRPAPTNNEQNKVQEEIQVEGEIQADEGNEVGEAINENLPENKENQSDPSLNILSPEEVRPFPKAGPRQDVRKARKKRQTAILTDTPIKEALEQEKYKAKEKKRNYHVKEKMLRRTI